mgnify:CR=1 FL=1
MAANSTLSERLQATGVNNEFILILASRGITTVAHFCQLFSNYSNIDHVMGGAMAGLQLTLPGCHILVKTDPITYLMQTMALEEAHRTMSATLHLEVGDQKVTYAAIRDTPAACAQTPLMTHIKLPLGYWDTRVAEYNNQVKGINKRIFPEQLLQKAESVLARMLFEHTTSFQYTAPALDEIWWARSQSTSKPRGWRHDNKRRIIDSVSYCRGTTNILGSNIPCMMSLHRDLQNVRWALIFCNWGSELEVANWIQWWTNLAQEHGQTEAGMRQQWLHANWQLCTCMRKGESFRDVTVRLRLPTADQK